MGEWQSSGGTKRPGQATGMRGWTCWDGGCSLVLKSQKLLRATASPPKHSSSCQDTAPGALGKQKCPCPSHHRDAVLCSQVSHPHQGCLALGLGLPRENQQFPKTADLQWKLKCHKLTELKRAVALLSMRLKTAVSLLPLLSLPSLPLATPPAKSHPRETSQHKSLFFP